MLVVLPLPVTCLGTAVGKAVLWYLGQKYVLAIAAVFGSLLRPVKA